MQSLRARFLARATEDLAVLRGVSPDRAAEVLATVHRLAGAAGIFGFPEVSRLASTAEEALRGEGSAPGPALAELIAALASLPRPD